MPRRRPAALAATSVLLAVAALAPAARAATPQPPLVLPGDARATAVRASGDWLVGARPTVAARRIARRHGARRIGHLSSWSISRDQARALAADLRDHGLLRSAEPDAMRRVASMPQDPLTPDEWWQPQVGLANLTPPPVTAQSPLLALVDARADLSHPEWDAGGNAGTDDQSRPAVIAHGTQTLSVAAAPANGRGMTGLWPGMRALNVGFDGEELSCADSARLIGRAIDAGAAVINMSYGSTQFCDLEFAEIQYATARGIVTVAAAGNEFQNGNPLEYPASLPHVLTVASIGSDAKPSFFSNSSAALDLSAPGEEIVAATPLGLDDDAARDGYQHVVGTSFAAPMVAAAAAWVRQVRPTLSADQVAQVIRISARDVGRAGWDKDTGFGILDVAAALKRTPPVRDPREPNDDIVWVDGRAFQKPDPPLWKGGKGRVIRALLDQYEDPTDVYPVRLPARSRTRIVLRPTFGDADLAVVDGKAKRISGAKRLASSVKDGKATDRVVVRNRSQKSKLVYVSIRVDPQARDLDAGYRLAVGKA
jgi:Subtilase family